MYKLCALKQSNQKKIHMFCNQDKKTQIYTEFEPRNPPPIPTAKEKALLTLARSAMVGDIPRSQMLDQIPSQDRERIFGRLMCAQVDCFSMCWQLLFH